MKIKTLADIKEEVAQEMEYRSWGVLFTSGSMYTLERAMNIVAERYAEQFKPKWVKVSERLPEKHERVQILEYVKGLSEPVVLQASWEGNLWRIYGGATAENVTHWQPIPEPPTE